MVKQEVAVADCSENWVPSLNDTDRITTVISGTEIRTVLSQYTAPYTVPYFCAQDYGIVWSNYGRKITVFSSFTLRKRPVNDAVLIDLGGKAVG